MNSTDLQILSHSIDCIISSIPLTREDANKLSEDAQILHKSLVFISNSIFSFSTITNELYTATKTTDSPLTSNDVSVQLTKLKRSLKNLSLTSKKNTTIDQLQGGNFMDRFTFAYEIVMNQLKELETLSIRMMEIETKSLEIMLPILDAHSDWILVTKQADHSVLYNNKARKSNLNHFQREFATIFLSDSFLTHIAETIASSEVKQFVYFYEPTNHHYSITSYPMHWNGEDAVIHYISDVTHQQLERETLSKIAYLDALTGIYNRHYCMNAINHLIETETSFSLIMVDINDLKIVNDRFGHTVGDEYICTVVEHLKKQIRCDDCICRMGGDEFVLLLRHCPTTLAHDKMLSILHELEHLHSSYKLSISYGISDISECSTASAEDLIKLSDEKMYNFKQLYKRQQLEIAKGMNIVRCLYTSLERFEYELYGLDVEKPCLVQIFTANLAEDDAVMVAKHIKQLLPYAKILGTSANTIIYDGEQYMDQTLITIEQYKSSTFIADIIDWTDKTPEEIVTEIKAYYPLEQLPGMMRVLFSGHYDETYHFLKTYDTLLDGTAIAGGLSSGQNDLLTPPFLFDETGYKREALSFIGVIGTHITNFTRVNTSTEIITPPYTINKTDGRDVLEIENIPAVRWFHKNLGFDITKTYKDFDDISQNDPFVRLQIVLENGHGSNRVLYYNHEAQNISQYFTKLPNNTNFHIGYASPSKCVDECKRICEEIEQQPIEYLFAYSCLVRKLYLHNCSNWELAPYKHACVCGMFLLGEFGYTENHANVYNGSCVLAGIAEGNSIIPLDMSAFEELDNIQEQHENLVDFIKSKRLEDVSYKADELLENIMTRENSNQRSLYIDSNLNMPNTIKYELDNNILHFNKLCLIKITNFELLLSYLGRNTYLFQLRMLTDSISNNFIIKHTTAEHLHLYSLSHDRFIIATTNALTNDDFLFLMSELESHLKTIQFDLGIHPFITRFVMVADHPQLLEHAYSQLDLHYSSQDKFIIGNNGSNNTVLAQKELDVINNINHAITNHKIIPYYQGIYNNKSKKIDKYEALMRIEGINGNLLSPFYFLDIAKKYHLYLSLTKQMIDLVLKDFWDTEYTVSLNISSLDISSNDVRSFLRDRISNFPDPSRLVFEILEDECFKDTTELKEFVDELKSFGVKVAVDDFGSGYSNLLEIVKIKPDFIKVDGQIIKDIHSNLANEIIISTISSMAQKLSIELVAEYVEDLQIQEAVLLHSIDYSQGYYFSTPHPFSKLQTKPQH